MPLHKSLPIAEGILMPPFLQYSLFGPARRYAYTSLNHQGEQEHGGGSDGRARLAGVSITSWAVRSPGAAVP